MIEKSELNYRRLIEAEIHDLSEKGLGMRDETKKRLLGESSDILRLASESKDELEFLAFLVQRDPLAKLTDFRYDHVIDFLIKRSRVSKESLMADLRSRIGRAVSDSESLEANNTTHGSMMAISADSLHGKPVFMIRDISTNVASNSDEAESWVDEKVGSGFQFVFILSKGGWKLLGADPKTPFSESQIESFFSRSLLDGLWTSHRPSANRDRQEFNGIKKAGGLN
jgi:hypothetical protein